MRMPVRSNPAKQAVVETESLPAPIGGWNARDPIAKMKPTDAIILDNWFPTAEDVFVRFGSDDHATGIGAEVESLLIYSSATANKMFAVAGAAIYDATSAGAVGAAVQSGLTNARWNDVQITTAGGSFMYAFNGVDSPRLFDGSTWTAVTGVSTPAITGVTTSTLIQACLWKRRIFMVKVNSMSVWYLPTDSIGGAASELNFGPLFQKGGQIMAVASYTLDSGVGPDDYFVIITSKGQVAVYRGTDPAAAATFALVGVYDIGNPIGRRCTVKVGAELYIITVDGVISLTSLISGNPVALTDKIRNAFATSARTYSDDFGWQGILFPEASFVLFNIPQGAEMHQYVMNTITKAWSRFKGQEANCWAILNDELYFGSTDASGIVTKAWTGQSDNEANITANAKQAFHYMGYKGLKDFKLIRPIFNTNGNLGAVLALNMDFVDQEPLETPTFTEISASLWDAATWDSGTWSGGLNIVKDWVTVSGNGFAASMRCKVATNGLEVHWIATDFVFERGGIVG